MDIEQLKYFQCLVETRNFTEAATRMNLSQSAFSRSIKRLEDEFGQPFFERKTRSVDLTDAGIRFQQCAAEILRLVEEVKSEISDDGKSGRLRIGAIPTVAPYFLPDLLRQFSDQFPDAQVFVHENTTDELIKRCKQGEIDLAILAAPVNEKYLETVELFQEELCLVLPKGHPLAKKKVVCLTDIEELPFVMLDEAHCLSDSIASFCRQRSLQPLVVERANQLAMVQELVSLSHGVSLIPQMAKQLDNDKRRVYRSLTSPTPHRTIVATTNPYRFNSRLLGEFQQQLASFAAAFRGFDDPKLSD